MKLILVKIFLCLCLTLFCQKGKPEPCFVCNTFYFFIYSCVGSLLLCGLSSSCGKRGLLSGGGPRASRRGGFPCCGARALGHTGLSSCSSRALGHSSVAVVHRLSCFAARWIFLDQGLNPSPALAGGFFTSELSRKPYLLLNFFKLECR